MSTAYASKRAAKTHKVLEHISQLAHARDVVVPHIAQLVEEELSRGGSRDVLRRDRARSRCALRAAARSDGGRGVWKDGDDLLAGLLFEMRRDELGDGVVEEVALPSPTRSARAESKRERATHLLVQDEVVGVAVRLLKRELRDVVVLDLLNGLLEALERVLHRLGLLSTSVWASSAVPSVQSALAQPR